VVAEGDRVGVPVAHPISRGVIIEIVDPTRPACGRPPSPKTGRDGPSSG